MPFSHMTITAIISDEDMLEFMIIGRLLNMSHTMHSGKKLYKLIRNYWEMGVFRTLSNNYSNYYFCKKNLKSLREFWMCQILNMSGFLILRVLNIPGFRICNVLYHMTYASIIQGSEYARLWLNNAWISCSDYGRVMNMPSQSFTGFEYASCFFMCLRQLDVLSVWIFYIIFLCVTVLFRRSWLEVRRGLRSRN